MSGYVIYDGPSMLDAEPIIAIATMKTTNGKTGDMIQSWILKRDEHPLAALKSGGDYSICGGCSMKGVLGVGRACYVVLFQAPLQIWKAWKQGNYDPLPTAQVFKGRRKFRFGAYGDPAAVPFHVWEAIFMASPGWTGYTHQWKDCPPEFKRFLMASVDNLAEYHLAKEMGWRTFRVLADPADILDTEIWCPATEEGGNHKQCATCGACDGTNLKETSKRRDIASMAHGGGKKYLRKESTCSSPSTTEIATTG